MKCLSECSCVLKLAQILCVCGATARPQVGGALSVNDAWNPLADRSTEACLHVRTGRVCPAHVTSLPL